jgi:hypothetical protein
LSMKKFLHSFLIFILPIIVIGVSSEILLRHIPNDYSFKKEYLDRYSDSIRILCLGNSHTFYGINPIYFSSKGFNAGNISQTLDYDLLILQQYSNHWGKLKLILIPISYSSLFSKLESGSQAWRIRNYYYYNKIGRAPVNFEDNFDIFSGKYSTNLGRIYSFYIQKTSSLSCSQSGWGIEYNSKNKQDLNITGIISAKKQTHKNAKCFKEVLNILKSILEFSQNRGVKVLLFTPPAFHTYIEQLDSAQLSQTYASVKDICKKYGNAKYIDMLSDGSFIASDFYDADHLNEIGAKKLTIKVDSIINKWE